MDDDSYMKDKKKYVAVFCSAAELEDRYVQAAKEFAGRMIAQDYHLVWGGSDRGLMKVIADEVEKGNGELIGVSIDVFRDVIRKNATETIISPTLGERKATMLLRSDAIAVLVGGIGTLDELMEVMELRKQKKHNKPIVVLNTDGFYDGLKTQLHKIQNEGFLHAMPLSDLVYFADTPEDAIHYINTQLDGNV